MYRANELQRLALRLLRRAQFLIIIYTVLGTLFGFIPSVGFLVFMFLLPASSLSSITILLLTFIGIVITIITGTIGYLWGSSKALRLELDSQLSLCMISIESKILERKVT